RSILRRHAGEPALLIATDAEERETAVRADGRGGAELAGERGFDRRASVRVAGALHDDSFESRVRHQRGHLVDGTLGYLPGPRVGLAPVHGRIAPMHRSRVEEQLERLVVARWPARPTTRLGKAHVGELQDHGAGADRRLHGPHEDGVTFVSAFGL